MANAVAAAKGVEVGADVMDDIFETAGEVHPLTVRRCRYRLFGSQAMSPQLGKKKPEY